MKKEYHIWVCKQALQDVVSPLALETIIQSNVDQDRCLKKITPRFHFDNDISAGLAFIKAERVKVEGFCHHHQGFQSQWVTLGHICHAVQDFYSHTNYVDLWLKAHGGITMTEPSDIEALDEAILSHPDLITGTAYFWRDFVYYIPVVKHLFRQIYIPTNSHEAMNLDSPARGPQFMYVLEASIQRTYYEYKWCENRILAVSGQEAVHKFQQGVH